MNDLKRTARITGAWYLGLAITGMLGFLTIRPLVYFPDDAAQTAKSLMERAALAHAGVALELGIVLMQALAALSFYKLLRALDPVSAFGTAAFGLMNAGAILASAACMRTALVVTERSGLAAGGDVVSTVQLLFMLSAEFWAAGAVFFGLWLIPMGKAVRTANLAPPALGWTLQIGGVGYVLSALVGHGLPQVPRWAVDCLTIPASIGEFWIMGYLLVFGVRTAEK